MHFLSKTKLKVIINWDTTGHSWLRNLSVAIVQLESQGDKKKELLSLILINSNKLSNKYENSFPDPHSHSIIEYTNFSTYSVPCVSGIEQGQIMHINKHPAARICGSSLWTLETTLPAHRS
jgi:hypothetical protein